jgi:hypothetical protein
MGHRRQLEEALKFNAYAAHAPKPHAARITAWQSRRTTGAAARPR